MNGADLVDRLRSVLEASNDSELAVLLGISKAHASGLRNKASVTPRQVASLILTARRAALKSAIFPIVESFPITKVKTNGGAKYELFTPADGSGIEHPYRRGLRAELGLHYGIYVFYDTRGRALYVGKARQQKLWNEMKSAFNRDRDTQSVRRVQHPNNRVKFRRSDEQMRQIQKRSVQLHELAAFFSAYRVADDMIEEVEAMLVRSFANDLLNVKMEKFSAQRGT